MKWNKLILLFSIIATCFMSIRAQTDVPFRIELQAPEDVYPYDVINLKEKGLIVYFENEIISKTEASWRFIHYDSHFKKKWVQDVSLFRHMEPLITYSDSLRVGILFKYDGKKQAETLHKLVQFELNDSLKRVFDLPFKKNEIPNILHISTDRAYFSYYENDKETFYVLKYIEGKAEKINLPKIEKGYVQFIESIPNSTQLIIGVRNDIGKKQNELIIYRVSIDGVVVTSFVVPIDDETFINQASAIRINSDSLIICGTYIRKNSIPSSIFSPKNELNTGVFSTLYSSQKIDSANCYNFSHNRNIFKFLSTKEQERQRKKIESERSIGEATSLNLQLLIHKPILGDSVVAFLTEAYYPEYRTEENVNYDFYGRPFPNSRTYFEGYRYTNAIISGFDYRGKLIWDNNFSLNEMISFDLKPRVSMCFDSSNVLMGYSYDGNINTMVINGYTTIQNPERSRIEALNSSDFIIKTEKPQLEYWYNKYFISYGYQKIRSSGKGSKNRDNAFFLNKMIYKE